MLVDAGREPGRGAGVRTALGCGVERGQQPVRTEDVHQAVGRVGFEPAAGDRGAVDDEERRHLTGGEPEGGGDALRVPCDGLDLAVPVVSTAVDTAANQVGGFAAVPVFRVEDDERSAARGDEDVVEVGAGLREGEVVAEVPARCLEWGEEAGGVGFAFGTVGPASGGRGGTAGVGGAYTEEGEETLPPAPAG
ncbi:MULTISPECIES: hypothetical protein [unclassified Streptomyces]|uniref:hypothetical protein n=1 Tax=unclassified Streptomyces TaxID=2593676 RepID=UPI001EFDA937|nr:hypothetical protein [Streptomyces sp. BvitLS-983]